MDRSAYDDIPFSKEIGLEALLKKRKAYKTAGQKVVFTNGCFDLIHAGHVHYLYAAKQLGHILVLGINSDRSVQENKGPTRPLMTQNNRIAVLSGLSMIDHVILFEDKTPVDLIEALKPDIHVKGGDYVKETLPEYPIVKAYGGKVVILPFHPGCSTTSLVQKIRETQGML
ncbi:MAG: D-glycero-beta-D-manno-heptose 1-phosphate adenylyltransferase [Candidatus Margulisiibacteriota bacterium]